MSPIRFTVSFAPCSKVSPALPSTLKIVEPPKSVSICISEEFASVSVLPFVISKNAPCPSISLEPLSVAASSAIFAEIISPFSVGV